MKRFVFLFIVFLYCGDNIYSQDVFDEFLKGRSKDLVSFYGEQEEKIRMFSEKQNAEFANFLEQRWVLFDEFCKHQNPFSEPKLKEAPIAPSVESIDLSFLKDNSVVRFVVNNINGRKEKEENNYKSSTIEVDFYGEKISFQVPENLCIENQGTSERDVANYFREISKYTQEVSVLWGDILRKADEFGLNDWGEFLLLRSLSEKIFVDADTRIAFCFYILRNEGGYKVKIARAGESNNLVLMVALDNSKEVYNYGFLNFVEQGKNVKYYLVYGAGKEEEGVYTYNLNEQDLTLSQMTLDFDRTLSIGKCDRVRELKINRMNSVINLPFNSKNIAFLDDVPQTIFPIYFASPMTEEAQQVLDDKFGNLEEEYSVSKAVDVLLNFVQTAFDYKTDGDQFGREKYFYPEEAVGYPFCDCEDRSALFGWLVQRYLGLHVVGLQYPGHLATAVCLGEDVAISGDAFMYGGKKYYVCDPTYIGAEIGMTMSQYEGVTPKVIKIKNLK